MATAIHVATESGDHYNFIVNSDFKTRKQVDTFLKKELDSEYEYISEIWADSERYRQIY